MLDTIALSLAHRLAPQWVPGATLHRRALSLCAAGRPEAAGPLMEAAALAYRRELAVEALARLRVHQSMAQLRARGGDPGESPMLFDIVQGVQRLSRLERLDPPHELDDARAVLAEWLGEPQERRAA